LLGSSDPEAVRQTVLDLTDKAVALTRYVFWIKDDEDPEKGRELSALVDKAFVIEGEKTPVRNAALVNINTDVLQVLREKIIGRVEFAERVRMIDELLKRRGEIDDPQYQLAARLLVQE